MVLSVNLVLTVLRLINVLGALDFTKGVWKGGGGDI